MQVKTLFSLTETELYSVFERLPHAVLIADDHRVYVYANTAATKLLGRAEDDIVGRRIEELAAPELREATLEQWSAFIESGVQRGAYQLERPDGTIRDVEYTALAGITTGLHVSFLNDVTTAKAAERALLESERMAKLALEARKMGSWVWDATKNRVSWNDTLLRIFGLHDDTAELSYEALIALMHEEDRAGARQKLGETALHGTECEIEYRIVRPDGQIRWISDVGRALFDKSGARVGLVGVCWDTTDAKAAADALKLSELRFRSLVEQSPFSTQIFAPDGQCLTVNAAWVDFWGAPAEAVKDYNILQDPQLETNGVLDCVRQAFAGEACELPVIAYRPPRGKFAGEEIWVRGFIYPVVDDQGKLREVVLIHEEVSSSRRLEQERAQQAEELARSNAELQRFVYVASHDLKEPLRNMAAFSQLVVNRSRERLSGDDIEYLGHIIDGAKRMAELIDGLLDYSRASFQRDLVLVDADFNELSQQAIANLRTAIVQTGTTLSVDVLPTCPCAPLNIVQLFQNLIGNAIKYAGGATPHIEITVEPLDGAWCFKVKDNGIGIDPDHHERIFGVFTRLHGREYSGTGIGLAICRAIVEKHRGKIWVESAVGAGATFCFTLPRG